MSRLISPPCHPGPAQQQARDIQMSKRVRPLNIAHHPGAWPPTCMATSCHYADALYSVGYTAVRKTSPALFSAGGCSSVDHQCPSSNGQRSRHGRPGTASSRRWRGWVGDMSIPQMSQRPLRSRHPRLPPSTSLACLALSSCEFASYPALWWGHGHARLRKQLSLAGHLQLLLSPGPFCPLTRY